MENGTVHNGSNNGVDADAIPDSPYNLLWDSIPPRSCLNWRSPSTPGSSPTARGTLTHTPGDAPPSTRRTASSGIQGLGLRAHRQGHAVIYESQRRVGTKGTFTCAQN